MRTMIEWIIDYDDRGWYLEWWHRGDYWGDRHNTRLESCQFEQAICEARKLLNLE